MYLLRGVRLWWPALAIGTLWLATSVVTTFYLLWLEDHYHRVQLENVTSISAAADMQAALARLLSELPPLPDPPDGGAVQRRQEAVIALHAAADRAAVSAYTDEERAVLFEIRVALEGFDVVFDAYRKAEPYRRAAATDELRRVALALFAPIDHLNLTNQRLLEQSAGERERANRLFRPARYVITILGPLIGIVVGYRVASRFLQRLTQIRFSIEHAAGGVVAIPLTDVDSLDDVDDLNRKARELAVRVQSVLGELQAARREAAQNERLAAIGRLAAGVAHELRNPLTAVKLLVQIAAQRAERQGLNAESLTVIQDEIGRMEQTIQSLLDFSRPPTPRPARHDLRSTVRRAVNLVQGRAAQDGVSIDLQVPADELAIVADAEQLHQVFVNLLLNGIEAMPGGGRLTIEATRSAAGGELEVRVRDRGEGVPVEQLPGIFEPFVTNKKGGTGLGLAISRRVVQEHGGALTAANSPDGGAVFTVSLPVEPLRRETD